MSIQKFPLVAVKKARQHIQGTLSLVASEQQPEIWMSEDEHIPEPESLDDLSGLFNFGGLSATDVSTPKRQHQWFVSTINPADALLKLPGLRLKPGVRLVGFLYRVDADGVGLVYAIPEALSTMEQLEKAIHNSGNLSQPPKPEGAYSHFMEAIEGDRSPTALMLASIFRRELQEFGVIGRRRSWGLHQFIDALPPQANCHWKVEPPPTDLSPKVKVLPDGRAVLEFFTYRAEQTITIYRHLDQYAVSHYVPSSLDKVIAQVQR